MTTIKRDAEGFLRYPEQWSESMAIELAREHGLEDLNAPQWTLIHALREHYSTHGMPPALTHVCWRNEMDEYCLPDLFPNSKIAWQIAGLPDPGEEAKSYMSDW